jgi:prophage regulatory protein
MAAQLQAALTILRRRQAEARTGLSRSGIYGKIKFNPKRPNEFDPSFPRPIKLGPGAKAVGWIEAEIDAWLNAQVENSRKTATTATTTAKKRGKTKTAG